MIANEGRRVKCICIKTMRLTIANDEVCLFERGKLYNCTIRDDHSSNISYKIYGLEFDLSCTQYEFDMYFKLKK